MLEFEEKIKNAFTKTAWAYKVMYHGVEIGVWDGEMACFHDSTGFDWSLITEARVFDSGREIRVVRGEGGDMLLRDSSLHIDNELARPKNTAYRMYGTDCIDIDDKWVMLVEERGGGLYFPKTPDFEGDTIMWLGIRNYLRFTDNLDDLRLEVCDYAFTGFKRGYNMQEVTLYA